MGILRNIIKTTRNKNSVHEVSKICVVGKKKHEEEKDINVGGKENKFVLT